VPPEPIYEFGPFRFDPQRRRLSANDEPVALSDRQVDILRALLARAGHVVAKDTLIEAAWQEVAVSDNSLEQAMSNLRKRLGAAPDGLPYIETLARRGYRFRAGVTSRVERQSDEALAALLGPYRTLLEGRAAVETLERDAVARARAAFQQVVDAAPDYASGHVGLANALALGFEATRASGAPDGPALERAVRHAQEACRLDPESGEPWATLDFVLSRVGGTDGVAAGRRATALEPDNWRHHLRLAYATWGEERLRAAREANRLLPGLALSQYLAATVHVARQALDEATRALTAGCEAQDRQQAGGRFGSVGLHLLLGLVFLAGGEEARAEHELSRELALASAQHIYTNQACAASWCAVGAIRLRQARTAEALEAFHEALERVPGHLAALASLSVVADRTARATAGTRLQQRLSALAAQGATVEAAIASGIVDALQHQHARAADRVLAALRSAPALTSAGWTIPVEPLLQVNARPDSWAAVLAILRSRAA
jgi:DNA-binding winged helix-turn-helix (wHTH) protein